MKFSLLLMVLFTFAAEFAFAAERDAAALAQRIDRQLDAHFAAAGIEVAPRADDAEFFRRLSLDLIGRVPRVAEVREFLADPAPDKRQRMIRTLLQHPRHAIHQANLWRAELLPEANSDRTAALLQRGFENWLAEQFRQRARYDQIVRQLITVPLPPLDQPAEPILRDPERANPLAFIAAKGKPENVAAAVTRTFLGIRLECAECHNHPFASWSQEQFWNQAAFFGGLKKSGAGLLEPLREDRTSRTVIYEQDKKTYSARLLDRTTDAVADERSGREVLADWLIAPANPFFARAGANRVWGQLFGVGLVEPVDDFHDENPASHPALLAEIGQGFATSGFDLDYLTEAICLTNAYQRTSARTHASQDNTKLPARMTAKGLTGEQFFDSLALVVGYRDEPDQGRARREYLSRFARLTAPSEPETSVQQALTLLNGRFIAAATNPRTNATLIAVLQTPGLSDSDRIETLYLATLGRLPTAEEVTKLKGARKDVETDTFHADVFWLLLNTAEFRLNH
ncbi:DUF1549 domain-containing protein [Anatilimnocola floriformis]|uniref:DUF1549 domain-containing protein n=1 Tax=Anatilimnocola floriformis TaxID=2948575 RepID=UPI0020C2504C|nr:DUF1549 domain-containing protein [Anatilimnocola floriformis]